MKPSWSSLLFFRVIQTFGDHTYGHHALDFDHRIDRERAFAVRHRQYRIEVDGSHIISGLMGEY